MLTLGKTITHQNTSPCPGHRVRVIVPATTSGLTQQILAIRFGGDKINPLPLRSK